MSAGDGVAIAFTLLFISGITAGVIAAALSAIRKEESNLIVHPAKTPSDQDAPLARLADDDLDDDIEEQDPRVPGVLGHGEPRQRLAAPCKASSAAGLLANVVVFFLPATDRARYVAEYRAELADLARSGVGRLRQLMYVFRQLSRAASMSNALRSPRRRSATP